VPYPVEAYPEGNQRHLSAESALYCRVYTEGMFGLRPTGFGSFNVTPRLPDGWAGMRLKNVHAFGRVFDLSVARAGERLKVEVTSGGKVVRTHLVRSGDTVAFDLGREP
jgi:cellobiose phosphorylase